MRTDCARRNEMPVITLPDGSTREFSESVSGEAIAACDRLAAGEGCRCDHGRRFAARSDGGARGGCHGVEIVTRSSPEGLELLRHDAAHVMAEAVKELYADTQVTIGPAIERWLSTMTSHARSRSHPRIWKRSKRGCMKSLTATKPITRESVEAATTPSNSSPIRENYTRQRSSRAFLPMK